jgi:hypothetical protein
MEECELSINIVQLNMKLEKQMQTMLIPFWHGILGTIGRGSQKHKPCVKLQAHIF